MGEDDAVATALSCAATVAGALAFVLGCAMLAALVFVVTQPSSCDRPLAGVVAAPPPIADLAPDHATDVTRGR